MRPADDTLRGRLRAGHQVLVLGIGVRIPAPEPWKKPAERLVFSVL